MWLVSANPKPALAVGFIVLKIAFKPFDMGFAFEGEHVGCDTIEKPAVMADDHGAAGKILECSFERS
jgi:hypothetical protein